MSVSLSRGWPWACAQRYVIGKQQLEQEFSVKVVEMPHTFADPQWLYAHPEARAEDLMNACKNPDITAIISTIGGEESIRLLPYIDFDIIRENPKIFLGYSDSTIIHFMYQKAGVISFYGPAIMAWFAENWGLFPYMVDSLQKTIFSNEIIWKINENKEVWTNEFLSWDDPNNQQKKRKTQQTTGWRWIQGSGIHQGRLIGGCLDVFPFMIGTSIRPSIEERTDTILFIETSEEQMSTTQFERIMRNLGSQGILHRIKGILLGRSQLNYTTGKQINYDQSLQKIINDELGLYHMPIITNMDFWHTDPMMVLPLGVQAELNCDQKIFSILESACQ